MKNIAVILKEQADKGEIVKLVQSLGGYWRVSPSKPDFEEGVVERGDALVLIDYSSDLREWESDYSPEEIRFLTDKLGVEPKAVVNLAVRRNNSSNQLAQEITEKIIQTWGGYLDLGDEDLVK